MPGPESRTATRAPAWSCSVLINSSLAPSSTEPIASAALRTRFNKTCCSWTRSPRTGSNPSASRVRTEMPFLIVVLRANTITSLIAALRSKRSFRGGASLICSRMRSMISPARSASPTTQESASLTSPMSGGCISRKFWAARALLRVAPGGAACALRGRYSSNQGGVPADEYGPVARGHRHHSHLWPSFQDRTHVQAGCASNRLIRLPFLDDGHDPVAIPEREPAPSSPVGSLPRTNPPENPCLSCLHAGWCHRAGPATVSLGRVSKAGLGLVRLLAQNHSSRHSTIGICRWQCDAPDD